MLSVSQASGFDEQWTSFLNAICVLVAFVIGSFIIALQLAERDFGAMFRGCIERGIASISEDLLGLDVSIGSISISVFQGKVILSDLKIANPTGCKIDSFLDASMVDIRLRLWSYAWRHFFGKVFVPEIDSILFQDVNLNIEKGLKSTNLQDILQKLVESREKQVGCSKSETGNQDSRLMLHQMTIAGAGATVPFVGRVPMPTVHCADFDKATHGKFRMTGSIVVEILRELCWSGDWADGLSHVQKIEGS